ncbi:MAG: glycosyltransferase family 4 protein, partial [Planctomycetota bacterium]
MFWRLQRAVLRSGWWSAPVLTYGEWPGMPAHVVPWFSTALTEEQVRHARAIVETRPPLEPPLRVLFVGRLSADKRVDAVIRSVQAASARAPMALTVVGDGPERRALEALAADVLPGTRFTGSVPHERVLGEYSRAHVLVLVSRTEGWPKAITEAMAFGCVPIGRDSGAVRTILANGRGIALSGSTDAAIAKALVDLAAAPERWRAISLAAAEWSWQYTLESFARGVVALMNAWWSSGNRPFPTRH